MRFMKRFEVRGCSASCRPSRVVRCINELMNNNYSCREVTQHLLLLLITCCAFVFERVSMSKLYFKHGTVASAKVITMIASLNLSN
jgi:hypothetical protein